MIKSNEQIALDKSGAIKIKTVEHAGSMSDYAGIILEALADYRRWFSETDTETDKDMVRLIDEAIDFVQGCRDPHYGGMKGV